MGRGRPHDAPAPGGRDAKSKISLVTFSQIFLPEEGTGFGPKPIAKSLTPDPGMNHSRIARHVIKWSALFKVYEKQSYAEE